MDTIHDIRFLHAFSSNRRRQRGQRPVGHVCCLSYLANISSFSDSAILSDVTTPANRARALSHVGIAFAICFCIGPPIGAYFASRPVPPTFAGRQLDLNIYATPAIITLVLLTLECIFLIVALPETRGKGLKVEKGKQENEKTTGAITPAAPKADVPTRLALLRNLRQLHLLFLGLFSGKYVFHPSCKRSLTSHTQASSLLSRSSHSTVSFGPPSESQVLTVTLP